VSWETCVTLECISSVFLSMADFFPGFNRDGLMSSVITILVMYRLLIENAMSL